MASTREESTFLTRLPTEIRIRIYEHLIGNRIIHIASSPLSYTGARVTYTVCTADQHGEDEAYALSKTWTAVSSEPDPLPDWEEVHYSSDNGTWLKEYAARHVRCLRLLKSFRYQYYDASLYKANESYPTEHDIPEGTLPLYQQRCIQSVCPPLTERHYGRRPCPHQADLSLRFGHPSANSFRQLHWDSFLHLSNLLRTCRQIYDEAKQVPFTSNTFALHVNDSDQLATMFDSSNFTSWQRAAIHSVALEAHQSTDTPAVDLQLISQVKALLPGLRNLAINISCPRGTDLSGCVQEDARRNSIQLPIVPNATVIVGHDHPSAWWPRFERRRQAIQVENLLTKGSLPSCDSDSDQTSLGQEDELRGEADLESQLDKTRIPKLPWPRGPEYMAHEMYN